MKVLFVVNGYYPQPNAIGACVMRLQEALLDKGIGSDIITVAKGSGLTESNKYGDIYLINGDPFKDDTSFKNRFEKIIKQSPYFFTWPIMHPVQLGRTKKLIKTLNERNQYKTVIGVMLPIEPVLAAVSVDDSIVLELDGLTCNPNYRRGIKKYLQHRVRTLEQRIFTNAGLIMHLNCNKDWFESEQYKKYSSKSVFTDLPNLIRFDVSDDNESISYFDEPDEINMVYAGALVKDYRSPEYLINLIKSVAKEIDMRAYFYTRGNCQQMIYDAEKETNGIVKFKEQVPTQVMDLIMMKSDFLLSIGNSMTGNDRSLPSKVITYMASGKPIIHIAGNHNDSAIPYLERYEPAIIIYPKDDYDINVSDLIDFIKKNKGKEADFDTVCKMFPQNVPEYTANIIIDHFNN